ncbi:hypothetical protein LTR85_002607 [Meristemomyces frigidus]|nr:hypothetical protein LTR85_002607 [Meristemomyces frigidus]
MTTYEQEKAKLMQHLDDSNNSNSQSGQYEEMRMTPLLSLDVKYAINTTDNSRLPDNIFPQHGLLGFHVGQQESIGKHEPILMNTNAPNSTFICGSQGSGKSHTLSCMLENCLLRDDAVGKLAKPLGGVVFHYDVGGGRSVAEAASLSSRHIPVQVLVSPSNYHKLSQAYAMEAGSKNITVSALRLQEDHLTAGIMLKLMAFSEQEGSVPLYMEVIHRILRKRATENKGFNFAEFDKELSKEKFSPGQKTMMKMRLDLLKSFFANTQTSKADKKAAKQALEIQPGHLIIIDLSDPGLVVALDEAHKYLNKSAAATNFTDDLLTTIREQRHNATRVIVATQEPSISEKLLDLCSISIVHHFNSPAWFAAIRGHLGGASSLVTSDQQQQNMFEQIVDLQVGESLVFSPSSFVCVADGEPKNLSSAALKMKTRKREGADTGRSKYATNPQV